MFFFFTCGPHTYKSLLKDYQGVTVQCQNCGNFSGRVYKRWQWMTFCFVPIIPFSLKPWHEVGCHICHFYQDIKYRPDVQNQKSHHIPMHNQAAAGGAPPGPPGQGVGMQYK